MQGERLLTEVVWLVGTSDNNSYSDFTLKTVSEQAVVVAVVS